ncbi:MAG TPA: cytochrome b/b6 domain-containing protein [Caulobacteraceae bacterium]|jgi:thiosulfate reductase cytochrome b subunit|nr:cytochrome b/b6 domain-containing protein [Caulobacteraceae bacterium]
MVTLTADRAPAERQVIYRHGLAVRLTHWINVLVISLLLMSGLNIFNAHPRLYWGQFGADHDHAWLWLAHGFPKWATLPHYRDLATARRWHFFLAWLFVINGAAYWLIGLINGHLRRDIVPTRADLAPGNLWRSILDHVRLRHPVGEAARRYNVLQKLAYVAVIGVLLPLMVITGLSMSPGFDAFAPWLPGVFGGRQSARAIHFITANLIVLFVIVHLVEVVLAGVVNELRSMITGRYALPSGEH